MPTSSNCVTVHNEQLLWTYDNINDYCF